MNRTILNTLEGKDEKGVATVDIINACKIEEGLPPNKPNRNFFLRFTKNLQLLEKHSKISKSENGNWKKSN